MPISYKIAQYAVKYFNGTFGKYFIFINHCLDYFECFMVIKEGYLDSKINDQGIFRSKDDIEQGTFLRQNKEWGYFKIKM